MVEASMEADSNSDKTKPGRNQSNHSFLSPPSPPPVPMAPIVEAHLPREWPAVSDFFEILQNAASAHEREVWQLNNEIKHLQALLSHEEKENGVHLPNPRSGNSWSPVEIIHNEATQDKTCEGDHMSEALNENVLESQESRLDSKGSSSTSQKQTGSRLLLSLAKQHSFSGTHFKGADVPKWHRFLNGPFDVLVGFLVVINAVVMFIEYEYEGYTTAVHLGIVNSDGIWENAQDVFQLTAQVFNIVFLLELILRLAVLRWKFFHDESRDGLQYMAVFDALIVFTSSIDMYIIQNLPESKDGANASVFRLMRLARVTRTLRVVRVMHLFSKLRVLVRTMAFSLMSLVWSMVVLGVLMFIGAIAICRFVSPFMMDDAISMETRLWLFEFYGTSTRAFYTMFEATLAGCWPNYARPLVMEVSSWFVIFWFCYIVVVVFAVTRVITALFLKDTMQVAQDDFEMALASRIHHRKAYFEKLQEVFKLADQSHDGKLTFAELEHVLRSENVRHLFAFLDLEIHEVWALFHLLEENGDGVVSQDEFLRGIVRLKGQARALDVVAIGRDCQNIIKVQRNIERVLSKFEDSWASNKPRNEWPTSNSI